MSSMYTSVDLPRYSLNRTMTVALLAGQLGSVYT